MPTWLVRHVHRPAGNSAGCRMHGCSRVLGVKHIEVRDAYLAHKERVEDAVRDVNGMRGRITRPKVIACTCKG